MTAPITPVWHAGRIHHGRAAVPAGGDRGPPGSRLAPADVSMAIRVTLSPRS